MAGDSLKKNDDPEPGGWKAYERLLGQIRRGRVSQSEIINKEKPGQVTGGELAEPVERVVQALPSANMGGEKIGEAAEALWRGEMDAIEREMDAAAAERDRMFGGEPKIVPEAEQSRSWDELLAGDPVVEDEGENEGEDGGHKV